MAPVIRISEATYNKMKLLAEPFVDTPDVVISRCLDEVLASRGLTPAAIPADGTVRQLDPDNPGDLRHTSVKSVRIGDEPLAEAHWNGLLRRIHLLALEQFGSFAALQAATNSKVREGSYEDDGFHNVVEGDFSIQGQDSNLCGPTACTWRAQYRSAWRSNSLGRSVRERRIRGRLALSTGVRMTQLVHCL